MSKELSLSPRLCTAKLFLLLYDQLRECENQLYDRLVQRITLIPGAEEAMG
jgi:hypothetical protein